MCLNKVGWGQCWEIAIPASDSLVCPIYRYFPHDKRLSLAYGTYNTFHTYTALSYLSRCEPCVVQHGWCWASGIGVGVHESASLLSHVWGALGGGGPTVDGSGWGRGAGRSWEPDVLIPRPVVRRGLPVGLLGKLVHLGQRNKCIDKLRVFGVVVWI